MRLRRVLPLAAAAVAILLAAGGPASGHPHVFVEVSFGLAFSDRGVERIEVLWRFDELYTQAMLPDYLKKGEKQLSAKAVRQLHDDVFRFLDADHYYTDIAVNGTPLLPLKAEG